MWSSKNLISVTLLAILAILSVQAQRSQQSSNKNLPVRKAGNITPECPESYGRYPTNQCDSYIECDDGVAEEKLCPDGLLFNAAQSIHAFPCQYPIDVDCTGREKLQPPQSTEDCPRQYGYYKIGDERNCGQFKNCVDGKGFVFDCPAGLAFDQSTYRCDWADKVADCDAEAYLGFRCPQLPDARLLGPSEYSYFRSADDCSKYFICIEGRPRAYHCGEERAFDPETNQCLYAENVTCGATPYFGEYRSDKPIVLDSPKSAVQPSSSGNIPRRG